MTSVVFVIWRLHDYRHDIDLARFGWMESAVLAVFALVYALANSMLAFGWWSLLAEFGVRTSRTWAIRVYGLSQLAKYVPGNVFQLAGRQALGMADGISAWPLAKSGIWELGLVSVAGAMSGVLAIPLITSLPVSIGTIVFFFVSVSAVTLVWRLSGFMVAQSLGWYLGFLAIAGAVFVGVLQLTVSLNPVGTYLPWVPLYGAYAAAWLAGLVTPGAPAGVGVRELVLLILLKDVVSEADLLLAVVVGRIVTVVGDLLFFVSAMFAGSQVQEHGRR